MNVRELIKELEQLPEEAEVQIWDAEADENVPIVQALYEAGNPNVHLLTFKEDTILGEYID